MSTQNRFPYNKHWHCMAYGFFLVVRRLLVPCCLSLFYSFDAWTCFFFSFSYIQRRRKGKEILRIFHKMLNYISCYIDLLVLMPNNSYQHVIVVAQIDSIVAFFWKALLLFVKRCFVWIIIYFQYLYKISKKNLVLYMKGKRFIPIKGNFHWKYCIRITSHVYESCFEKGTILT